MIVADCSTQQVLREALAVLTDGGHARTQNANAPQASRRFEALESGAADMITPSGGAIHIRVSDTPSGPAIDVRDTGPGIAPEVRTRIFDRYDRGGNSRSDGIGGSGLGLAVAKWAVEVNGGHINVESNAHGGSVFRIVLPIGAAPTTSNHEHATQPIGGHA